MNIYKALFKTRFLVNYRYQLKCCSKIITQNNALNSPTNYGIWGNYKFEQSKINENSLLPKKKDNIAPISYPISNKTQEQLAKLSKSVGQIFILPINRKNSLIDNSDVQYTTFSLLKINKSVYGITAFHLQSSFPTSDYKRYFVIFADTQEKSFDNQCRQNDLTKLCEAINTRKQQIDFTKKEDNENYIQYLQKTLQQNLVQNNVKNIIPYIFDEQAIDQNFLLQRKFWSQNMKEEYLKDPAEQIQLDTTLDYLVFNFARKTQYKELREKIIKRLTPFTIETTLSKNIKQEKIKGIENQSQLQQQNNSSSQPANAFFISFQFSKENFDTQYEHKYQKFLKFKSWEEIVNSGKSIGLGEIQQANNQYIVHKSSTAAGSSGAVLLNQNLQAIGLCCGNYYDFDPPQPQQQQQPQIQQKQKQQDDDIYIYNRKIIKEVKLDKFINFNFAISFQHPFFIDFSNNLKEQTVKINEQNKIYFIDGTASQPVKKTKKQAKAKTQKKKIN